MVSAQTSPKAPTLPDNILRRLAEIGRVPVEEHDFFFESVRDNVGTACQLDRLGGALSTKRGKDLADAAITLYDALGNLNNGQRRIAEATLSDGKLILDRISSDGVRGIEKTIYQLTLLFCLLTGKPSPRFPIQPPQSPSRGRRSGSVKNWIAQNFISDLLISTTNAGGALTLEKNIRKGSLIDAVGLLTHYLPDRLALSRLSTSTLQRIKDAISRAQRASDEQDLN
jgi:hypothetical protein